MIIKIQNEDGGVCVAVTMDNYDDLACIYGLQNAVAWAIKSLSEGTHLCGKSPEIFELANLLEAMQFTRSQLQKIDRAIFTEKN